MVVVVTLKVVRSQRTAIDEGAEELPSWSNGQQVGTEQPCSIPGAEFVRGPGGSAPAPWSGLVDASREDFCNAADEEGSHLDRPMSPQQHSWCMLGVGCWVIVRGPFRIRFPT